MRNLRHMRRLAGSVAFALLTTTGAMAAGPAQSAIGSAAGATAATVDITPAVNRVTRGKSASNYLHLARKGRRGYGRRAYGNRGFRHRNRRLHGHYYGRRHRGGAIAAGIAGLIIGGAIAASRRDYGDRWERCDASYRTFRWSDGTYIPYAGSGRVLCPYLRR